MKQHSPQFTTLVTDVKREINEITSLKLKEKLDKQDTFTLIDVREESEWIINHIPTAMHLSKGVIERDIEKTIPDLTTPIILYCSGGFRSALATSSLQKMGYTNVSSLVGGLQGWVDMGFAVEQKK